MRSWSLPDAGRGAGRGRAGPILAPAVILASLAGILCAATAWIPFPRLEAFLELGYSTRILDRRGGLLAILPAPGGMRREHTSLGDHAPGTVRIFTGSEDRRFFLHPGVDPLAILRGLSTNLLAGRTVSGASTITMQLARLVSPGRGGLRGKIADAIDAFRIEAKLSKHEILELYLDSIPFGSTTLGLTSASRLYFGKMPAFLTPSELCLLAVIPRSPALYDPRSNPGAAGEAAARLAVSLALSPHIVPDTSSMYFTDLAAIAAEGARRSRDLSYPASVAPHFIRHWFAENPKYAAGPALGFVTTSLDPEIQSRLLSSIRRQVAMNRIFRMTNGSGLVVDTVTGEILAWVGSADFGDDAARGQIDGVRARGQPGSCLKPFLYSLAMERGFTPATILRDLPADFGSEEAYVPLNFDNRFNGPVRLRVALASSLNVPAVHILEQLGLQSFHEYLEKLGFDSIRGMATEAGLGLALGNAPVTLLELVRAFSVFPRGGVSLKLAPVPANVRRDPEPLDGKVLSRSSPSLSRVMSPYTAGIIRDILSDQPSRFAGFAHGTLLDREYEAMFKTGTANQFQHVWALGSTPDFTAGIWMGNFTGETVIGKRSSGVPAAVLVDLLDGIAKPESRFPPVPDSVRTEICALSGLLATPSCPGSLTEYLPRSGPPPGSCDLHGSISGSASPVLARRPVGQIRFVHPRDGAVFYYDPSLPPEDQAIGVRIEGLETMAGVSGEAAHTSGRILLRIDGREPIRLSPGGDAVIPLARGEHRLALILGGSEVAFSRFSVR